MASIALECAGGDDLFTARLIVSVDEPPGVYFSFYVSTWYSHQESFWGRLRRKLRLAWLLLRGKEYQMQELVSHDAEVLADLGQFLSGAAVTIREWEIRNIPGRVKGVRA